MKQEIDQGTPELQAKKATFLNLATKGIDHLFRAKTLDAEQYHAGCIYRAAHEMRYRNLSPKSFLDNLTRSEGGAADPSSDYWQSLMTALDGKELYTALNQWLVHKTINATGKNLLLIVHHIAGQNDWGIDDVCRANQVTRHTASARIRHAFDLLIVVVDNIKDGKECPRLIK